MSRRSEWRCVGLLPKIWQRRRASCFRAWRRLRVATCQLEVAYWGPVTSTSFTSRGRKTRSSTNSSYGN